MSFDYCADLVRRGDPDRFLSAMAAPPAGRARLLALYAFVLEIARAAWSPREPLIARMRLQFWRDALGEMQQGAPPRRHPVLQALVQSLAGSGIGAERLSPIVEARMWDVEAAPMTEAGLESYLHDTAVVPMTLAAELLDAPAAEAAAALGQAMGAAGILRALPRLAGAGRMPLPGVSRRDAALLAEGEVTAALAAAAQTLARQGLAQAVRGRALARQADRRALPALRAGWRSGSVLRPLAEGVDFFQAIRPESEARRRFGHLVRVMLGRV
ncbi:MAG: phytoene synthase [Alphaproteobacteria bacterium]|nr:MAG: phytoene synthase [Alphaproteobacteria bacterium]